MGWRPRPADHALLRAGVFVQGAAHWCGPPHQCGHEVCAEVGCGVGSRCGHQEGSLYKACSLLLEFVMHLLDAGGPHSSPGHPLSSFISCTQVCTVYKTLTNWVCTQDIKHIAKFLGELYRPKIVRN